MKSLYNSKGVDGYSKIMKSWGFGHNREVTRMKACCDRCTISKQTQARQNPNMERRGGHEDPPISGSYW